MKEMSDVKIRDKGFNLLFKELGAVDAIRFLSLITHERRDYLELQEKLFKGMSVDEIYRRAKEYEENKGL